MEFEPNYHFHVGVDSFTQAYFECMEFTDCRGDNPDMESANGWSPDLIASGTADCEAFQADNAADLALAYEEHGYTEEQAGNDFWLTRCGHGAGFWDRGLGAIGKRLSDAAKVYGNVDLYAGDDNLVHGS